MNCKLRAPMFDRIARLGVFLCVAAAAVAWQAPRVYGQSAMPISDSQTPATFTKNDSGSTSTFVMNSDSSLDVLQNGALVSGVGCGPILPAGDTVTKAEIWFDSSTNRLYTAIEADSSSGSPLGTLVTFVTVNGNGACTPGPSVTIAAAASLNSSGACVITTLSYGPASLAIAVDPGAGNIYVLQGTSGITADTLTVLSIPALSTLTSCDLPQFSLDYSASYGPLVIDSSTHRVYINDFGASQNLPPGLNASPGFFVFDPNHSTSVSSNLQHVYGYVDSSGTQVPLSAQALLVHSGDLYVVNQNTSVAGGHSITAQTVPYTVLHTTAPGFSFFTNTQTGPGGASPSVYIEPGTSGINTISTTLGYTATGAADIDSTGGYIYRFAYNATSSSYYSATPTQGTGALIRYNLVSQTETQLTSTSGSPLANVYPNPAIAPWSQMTFSSRNDNVTLAIPAAVGVSSSFACPDVSIDQVFGGGSTYESFGEAALNFTSGYVYDTATVYPNTTLYAVPPPSSCAAATLVVSPTVLLAGTAGQPYSQQFSVTSGAVGSVAFTPVNIANGIQLSSTGSFAGTPTEVGTFQVPVAATDSVGNTGTANIPLTINCQTITIGPATLPLGVQFNPYSVTFTQTGGIGNVTFQTFGPYPNGISPTSNGLSGIPSVTGSFPIGIQVTDANGCKSANTIETLTIATPKFTISPLPPNGLSSCGAPGPGFPTGVVPMASFENVNSYEVTVTIFNSGNVSGIANLKSATLGGFLAANPPSLVSPVVLGSSGAPMAPGQCATLTFFYPTSDYTGAAPLSGYTLANIPQVLRLSGSYNIVTTAGTGPTANWSLTDRGVDLSGTLCCTNTAGVLSGSTTYNPNAGGPIGVGGNP